MGQTLCIAEFFAAVIHLEHDRCFAGGMTVLTDGQVVHVAEAEKTGIAADLVDDVLLNDLMFALQEDKERKHTIHAFFNSIYINLDNKGAVS